MSVVVFTGKLGKVSSEEKSYIASEIGKGSLAAKPQQVEMQKECIRKFYEVSQRAAAARLQLLNLHVQALLVILTMSVR